MIDLELTHEQRAIRDLAHRFAEEEMRPVAAEYDEKEELPWEVLEKAAEIGLTSFAFPEECGGAGITDLVTRCLVDEELFWGCAGMASALGGTMLAATPILLAGSPDQQERFLPRLCDPETVRLGCFALTEPDAGSDAAGMKTNVRRDGSDYVLNGTKCFITNGGIADTNVVFATLDPGAGLRGITAFVVPSELNGVVAGRKGEEARGFGASHTAMIQLRGRRRPGGKPSGGRGRGLHHRHAHP